MYGCFPFLVEDPLLTYGDAVFDGVVVTKLALDEVSAEEGVRDE